MSKNKIGRPKKRNPAVKLVAFRLTNELYIELERLGKNDLDDQGRPRSASEIARKTLIRALKGK
jgi:hypothetical protein